MHRYILLLVSALFLLPLPSLAQTTSTLAAETGDNTSVGTFPQHDNGNVQPGNVSKLDTRTLLYPGATTKIYAHVQTWFCMPGSTGADGIVRCNGHITTGYNSNDAAQVKKQVDDMVSRGIQGMVIDWYGQGSVDDSTTLKIKAEAESRTGFEFVIMEDKGAVTNCTNRTGLSRTQCAINDLNYVASTYYASPAYMHRNGRPVVFFFIDASDPIDWNAVRAGVQGNPYFIFEDNFTRTQADGAFAWVKPGTLGGPQPDFQGYLTNYYSNAQANSGKIPVGAASKGFDDRHATWAPSPSRFMDQACGQTFLQSIAVVNQKWSASNQLANLGLVTWNDYDEGSEIESGIDNCLSISASIAGSTVSWSLAGSGQEDTLDRYRIWSTTDGSNLTLRAEVTAGGAHSYDLSTLGLPAGTYTIYVQAVGKPSLLNHMANGVSYTSSGGGGTGCTGTVSISAPTDGSTVNSPFTVSAAASADCAATDMKVFVDSVQAYDQPNTQSINASVSAGTGAHQVMVQATYANATTAQSTVNVTVAQSNAANNIDDASGWQNCTTVSCCGGNGSATTSLTQDTATSRDGRSARFDLGGSGSYSNARWWNQVASTGWTTKHFAYDVWAYVSNASAPQALDFDWAVVVNGQRYYFGQQCDFKGSGLWRVWSNGNWTATSRGCAVFSGTWNHFILHGEITADNRIHYQDIVINNVTYTFDLYATPSSQSGGSTTVYLQLAGNASQTPYSLWIDQFNFTSW
ncbi:MAG TPA: Ig-like domain-containing protein [Thermoanaerobaculia bacterium]